MAKTERCQDLNQSLIEKVRSGKSPTPKDRHDRTSYGFKKSSEDAKIRIQKDILDSLKEKDGASPLVYPQDYIFDIAHFRANGNLGELIDDMSNITNPEEKFEMVKSENKILRERLHNALQREMKAIKSFQKLTNDNRLLLLRLKEYEKVKKEIPHNHNDTDVVERHSSINGDPSPPARILNSDENIGKRTRITLQDDVKKSTVNKSTWTSDPRENMQSKSTSTHDLPSEDRLPRKKVSNKPERNTTTVEFNKVDTHQGCDDLKFLKQRRELFKTNSSPNILEDLSVPKSTKMHVRVRSSSLDMDDQNNDSHKNDLHKVGKSASSDAINSHSGLPLVNFRKLGEKRNTSFLSSSLGVVNEETDQSKHSHKTTRSSSVGNISPTHSTSSEMESSPCQTPSIETPKTKKYQSSVSLNLSLKSSTSAEMSEKGAGIKSGKDESKKKSEKTSSSEESDKEEKISSPYVRRRGGFIANNDFAADIRKFQNMFNNGEIPQSSHESDDEQDILEACEAARNQKYSCRRGSSVVQIPESSVQMDLHVATDEPSGVQNNGKKTVANFLSLEDKRLSRWSSILKNKKKLLLHKDRLRISENLKEYLSTKVRPTHISSETDLSLYKDTHWTHLMKVTDESGHYRRLSEAENQYCLTDKEIKRREAVWELFHSEVVYLTAHLLVLKECFLEPLREIQGKGFLINIDDRKIFLNLEELCLVSSKFAKDLLNLFKNEQENQFGSTASVVSAFTEFRCTVHPQYERYCLSYTNTLNYLETLKRMEHVQEFFKWCEADSRCNRLKLTDLLVAPFQHFTKYPLLLKNIRKRTSEGDRQHAPLSSTIKSVELLIQGLESNIAVVRNYQKLKELQKNLVWPSVGELDPKSYIPELLKGVVLHQECGDILASPKRQLIYQGTLTLYENTKTDVFVFLFDDMLLLTKGTKKSNRNRKISMGGMQYGIQESFSVSSPSSLRKTSDYNYHVWKQPVPIDRFVLHDLDEYQGNSIRNCFVLVHKSRFKQAIAIHTLQASSKNVKDTWISKLKETQDKWKEAIKQEDLEGKCKDDYSKDHGREKNNEDEKTYSDSEQESTNSDHNSSDEEEVFDEDDIEVQAVCTNSDANNNAQTPSERNSQLNNSRRKISRPAMEI